METICAICTALHPAAVGIVRVSGPQVPNLASILFKAKSSAYPPFPPGRLVLGTLQLRTQGREIPHCLFCYFAGPHSYTGEDCCEFHCIGNPILLADLVDELVVAGCSVAKPGEFTRRAWENGRIDLTTAEILNEFVRTRSRAGMLLAASQFSGELFRTAHLIRERLIHLLSTLEASIEFGETDRISINKEEMARELRDLLHHHDCLLKNFSTAQLLREGRRIAISGKANVGKSTLFNYLAGQERAIVHPQPGTTRDILREIVELGGIAVTLHDTAGLRTDSDDGLEVEGMRRTRRLIEECDGVILVADGSAPLEEIDRTLLRVNQSRPCLLVINKADLGQHPEWSFKPDMPAIRLSLRTGLRCDSLIPLLRETFGKFDIEEGPLLVTLRQKECVSRSKSSLQMVLDAYLSHDFEEVVVEDLRLAAQAMGELSGDVCSTEIIDRIFADFCIGK